MSLAPLFLVSTLLHVWVGWRLLPTLAASTPWAPLAWLLGAQLLASALLLPLSLLARRLTQNRWVLGLSWLGLLCMGLFSTMWVLTVLRDLLLLLGWGLQALTAGAPPTLDGLRTGSAVAVPMLALLATVWGFWNARRTARVVRVEVPIAGLPLALHGFTVAQISDIHVGPTIRQPYLQRIVARVNTLGADMVAITGDLVDGQVADLQRHVAPLAGLSSTHGTFFVTGNHEYYSGAHAWIAELRRLGLTVLMNEHVVLQHASGGAVDPVPLVVAGVADFGAHQFDPTHRSDPRQALAGAPADVLLRLLLAHQPRSAPAASAAGFQLQLSGHTHGGQFWPWMHFVKWQQPFTSGLHKVQDLWVYINRGTGYWGPPKRFGVPSEITHLRLVRVV